MSANLIQIHYYNSQAVRKLSAAKRQKPFIIIRIHLPLVGLYSQRNGLTSLTLKMKDVKATKQQNLIEQNKNVKVEQIIKRAVQRQESIF